jgi:diacylglycerol kinase family enzyme
VGARLRVTIVINPVAGVRGTLERARRRAEWAIDLLRSRGADPDVFISERRGHARELAAAAAATAAEVVAAWGGDGTVNEVASALAGSDVALAVIPAGSGNGLARMLGVPADPRRAIDHFLQARRRLPPSAVPVAACSCTGRLSPASCGGTTAGTTRSR